LQYDCVFAIKHLHLQIAHVRCSKRLEKQRRKKKRRQSRKSKDKRQRQNEDNKVKNARLVVFVDDLLKTDTTKEDAAAEPVRGHAVFRLAARTEVPHARTDDVAINLHLLSRSNRLMHLHLSSQMKLTTAKKPHKNWTEMSHCFFVSHSIQLNPNSFACKFFFLPHFNFFCIDLL